MADIDNTIALKVQTPNMLNTLGNIMDVSRKRLALSRERETYQADVERSKAESQTAQTQSASAQWKLKGDQAQKAFEIAGGLVTDPAIVKGDAKGSVDALMNAEDRMRSAGIPEDQIRVHMGPMYAMAANNPQKLQQTLKNVIMGGMGAGGQAQAMQPSGPVLNTGQVQQQMNINPLAGPAGPVQGAAVQNVLPPTQPIVDPQGRPGVLGPTGPAMVPPQGPVVAPRAGPPMGVNPQQPRGFVPTGVSPTEATQRPARAQQQMAVNAVAAKAPEMQFNNDQIIELADKALTGTGSERASKLFSTVGLHWDPKDMASNAQRLNHFMALQAQNNAAVMGAGTDAAREVSKQATGSSEWNPAAIASTAKINNALISGVQHFNKGMEKAVQAKGGDAMAIGDFQNQWAQNFDVNAMRLVNALEKGDKKEYQQIIGGLGSLKAKELAMKVKNLKALTDTGTITQ